MEISVVRFDFSLRAAIVKCLLLALAGCAAFDGRGLVPGSASAAQVEALMGRPAEKITAADGDSIWFYPRQPMGRATYAVRIAPDGTLRGIEQRLTEHNMKLLVAGSTTMKETRELLGPPWQNARNFLNDRDCWDYRMYGRAQGEFTLSVQFSDDGLLREVYFLEDYRVSGRRGLR
jgi:hypothetical protein